MKVIYHLGVHCTDKKRLERCLRRNATVLGAQGIVIPDPDIYRPIIGNVVNAMKGAPSSHETEETILDAVMVEDEAERIVFCNEAFICVRSKVLAQGMLYANAAEKIVAMANLLPSCAAEMTFAIRNPATFLPALFQTMKNTSFEDFMRGTNALNLSWANMVRRVREAAPDLPLTIWCDEDTPLIWPEVLRAVAGCPAEVPLKGEDDLLAEIMTPEGMTRLRAYLSAKPGLPVASRRKVVAAFLDKYALDEAMEVELDLPGWDDAYVEALTARYDADVRDIASIPGVTLLTPWDQAIPSAAL